VALLAYEDAGRDLIARLKYRNARSSVRWLVVLMASLVRTLRVDVVTWMPTTSTRRYERGFDQAQLLARGIARELHVPCRRLLLRSPGPPQTGRSLADRRRGPLLRAPPGPRVPAHVLLVDDVITTGTSVSIAARELRRAGAARVTVVAAARTPLKRARAASEIESNGAG
jgi:predicted amidophosphoribosyltransferase